MESTEQASRALNQFSEANPQGATVMILIDNTVDSRVLDLESQKRWLHIIGTQLLTLKNFKVSVMTSSPMSVLVPPTCDADIFSRITSIPNVRGVIQMFQCLEQIKIQLQKETNGKLVIVLVDICMTPDTAKTLSIMTQHGIQVMCIGVGVDKNIIIQNSSPQMGICYSTYAEANQYLPHISIKPNLSISLRLHKKKFHSLECEAIFSKHAHYSHVQVECKNNHKTSYKEFELHHCERNSNHKDKMYLLNITDLEDGMEVFVRVRGKLGASGSWGEWNETVKYSTLKYTEEAKIMDNEKLLKEKVKELAKLLNLEPLEKIYTNRQVNKDVDRMLKLLKNINVLLLSPPGKGKTSYVRSYFSAVTGSSSRKGIIGNGGERGTTETSSYSNAAETITLLDIFGDEGGIYEQLIDLVLQGYLPDKTDINCTVKQVMERIRAAGLDTTVFDIKRHVHAILLLFSAHEIDSRAAKDSFKRLYDMLKKRGYEPIVVVTKIDKACEFAQSEAKYIYSNGYLDFYVNHIATAVGVEKSNIFPLINYDGGNYSNGERNYAIEFMVLNCLKKALETVPDTVQSLMSKNTPTSSPEIKPKPSTSTNDTITMKTFNYKVAPDDEDLRMVKIKEKDLSIDSLAAKIANELKFSPNELQLKVKRKDGKTYILNSDLLEDLKAEDEILAIRNIPTWK